MPEPDPRRPHARLSAVAGVLGIATLAAICGATVERVRREVPVARTGPSTAVAALRAPTPALVPRAPACPTNMILVPGGAFFMGSDEPVALDFERPAHQVRLDAFCIDRTEVIVAAYKACSDAGECRRALTTNEWDEITGADRRANDALCNANDPEGRGDHPLNCVDHGFATAYCARQGGRLPTEAEWEFAARGPDGRMYPWGDDAPSAQLLNACGRECTKWGAAHRVELPGMHDADDGFPTTAPVGSFPKGASRFGLQDVVGNVWEWVSDWYAPYRSDEQQRPRGPEAGTERVMRGGAWNGAYADWVRPTFRYKSSASTRSHGIGFRCAADPR